MLPTTVFHLKQGDTFQRVLTLQNNDGTAIDLTGVSVEFSIAASRGSQHGWTWQDDDKHATVTNPQDGQITISLSPDDTRELQPYKEWEYEVTITFPDDTRLTILDGKLLLAREVRHEP